MSALREQLEKAIKGDEHEDEADTAGVEAEAASEEQKADTGGGVQQDGKSPDKAGTDDKQVVEQGATADDKGADDEGASKSGEDVQGGDKLEAPEHWAAKDKELFSSIPKEGQEFLLRRHKEMEADYTRNKQELSETRKQVDEIGQHIKPFEQFAQQQGMTTNQLVAQWAQAQNMLLQGKGKELLHGLAQMYNIDIGPTPEQGEEDPRIARLNETVAELQNRLNQTNQTIQTSTVNTMQERLNQFAEQKDEKGNLLHPHFDDVMEDMTYLAKIEKQQGRTPDINKIYERAVWMNPEVREKILASQREAEAEKARQDAERKKKEEKERAEKANLASAHASGDGSAPAPTQDGSDLRSLIKSQIDQQKGRI